ncbi:CvfB family protein [Solitalea koreensis]|nr:S1-like domain-containing RNA-binding protein [Solitalea koreensis]
MIEIGKENELTFINKTNAGLYLSDGIDEVLLPYIHVPDGLQVGDSLSVFVYLDNENKPIATTQKPLAYVGQFAYLTVIDANEHGAFLDLGIAKDIFVPYMEQRVPMEIDEQYIVYLYLDELSGRIVASSKIGGFLQVSDFDVNQGDEVQLLITEETDLGYNAIINNKYIGLLYHNELFEPLQPGDVKKGFIKQIREDNKIDLSLQRIGFSHILDLKTILLEKLEKNQGKLNLGDKSSPDEIYKQLKISKKAFKKSIGGLYKERLIEIDDEEIRLIPKSE